MIATLVGLALLSPAGWPAGPLDAAQVKQVEAGQLVSVRTLSDGVLSERLGATIEQDPAWVTGQLRQGCFLVRPPQLIDARFFDAKTMKAQAAKTPFAKLEREDVEAIAPTPCARLQEAATFYGYALFDSPGFFPDAWTLTRYEVTPLPEGGMRLVTQQVAGSTGDAKSTLSVHRVAPGRAVVTGTVTFELGIPMPDSVLHMIIDTDEEATRATQVRHLRARARLARP